MFCILKNSICLISTKNQKYNSKIVAASMCIFRSVFKEHERETQKTCVLVSTVPFTSHMTLDKLCNTLSFGFLRIKWAYALPVSESGGKNVIGSALQTIKHFVNTYSVNKYLLRADYVHCSPSTVSIITNTAPLQLHHWVSVSNAAGLWSQATHPFTQLCPQ